MKTFGDRLKSEREDSGLTIEAVAEILHVDQDRLQALECNDFTALPDEAVMRDCLTGYADCLKVDADLMIEDYVRERENCLRELDAAVTEQVARAARVATPTAPHQSRQFSKWFVPGVVVTLALLAMGWMVLRDGSTPESPAAVAPADPQPIASKTPPANRTAPVAATPTTLSIPEYGVGTAVENRQLQGRSERFAAGTQVWFWTRVNGGNRGDRIDHVWLREGVETARVSLKLGGSSWRTYSKKTLKAGAAGDWAVEVRDDAGRVLARSEFVCVP